MDQVAQDEITIKELIVRIKEWFLYVKTKWVIIVLAGLIGAGIGFKYASVQKPKYTATLSFALEDEKGGGGSGLSGLASQFGFDVGNSAGGAFAGLNNLIDLMKSRAMIEKTLLSGVTINNRSVSLADYYIELMEWRKAWSNEEKKIFQFAPSPDRSAFTLQKDSMLGLISNDISGMLSVAQKDLKVRMKFLPINLQSRLLEKYLFFMQKQKAKKQDSIWKYCLCSWIQFVQN
jgi:hypothetical protein